MGGSQQQQQWRRRGQGWVWLKLNIKWLQLSSMLVLTSLVVREEFATAEKVLIGNFNYLTLI
jgi:hypothetical protein